MPITSCSGGTSSMAVAVVGYRSRGGGGDGCRLGSRGRVCSLRGRCGGNGLLLAVDSWC